MAALIKISTQDVLQNWGDSLPDHFVIPGVCSVHCPAANWTHDDYELVPVIYTGSPPNQFSEPNGTSQVISNGALVITSLFVDPSLSEAQKRLCTQIDSKAESIRLKYITAGAGQMGVYTMKLNEALVILADPSPVANAYPLNAASIGLPGINTITDAANSTMGQYNQWIAVAGAIEAIRLMAKNNINSANSIIGAISAFTSVNWGSL